MAGSIVDGEVQAGMFLRVAFNSALEMTVRIRSIEFARRPGGEEDICLCFEAEPDLLEAWRGLNFRDETFEVTPAGTD